MSLRLILIRHAKSDPAEPGIDDHGRPLNRQGRRAAPALGDWLAGQGHVPDLALLSTAARVRETWDGIAPGLGREVPVRHDPSLYHAAPEAVLAALSTRTEGTILVLGHNPGLASLAQWLVVDTPDRLEFHRFPSGATLVLAIARDAWMHLEARCARIEAFVVPCDLPGQ